MEDLDIEIVTPAPVGLVLEFWRLNSVQRSFCVLGWNAEGWPVVVSDHTGCLMLMLKPMRGTIVRARLMAPFDPPVRTERV